MLSRQRIKELETELVGAMNWCPSCDDLVLKTGSNRSCPICDGIIYGRAELTAALRNGTIRYLSSTGLCYANNLGR